MEFDKDNIPEAVIKKIEPLIQNELFTPEVIKKVSSACTAICTWVHAMHTYYFIAREVEPKRKALAGAKAELGGVMATKAAAEEKLAGVLAKLSDLDSQ